MLFPLVFMSSVCTLQKRAKKQKITYTGSTGTPVVGQTITGQTSLKTAVIDRIGTGYLVVKTVSGSFTVGELIKVSTTFTATLATIADYENQYGEHEYYWATDQSSVACRFGYSGKGDKGLIIHETGQLLDLPVKVALPDTITLTGTQAEWAENYRIVTTAPGFAGTYQIMTPYVISGISGVDHYSFILKAVQ